MLLTWRQLAGAEAFKRPPAGGAVGTCPPRPPRRPAAGHDGLQRRTRQQRQRGVDTARQGHGVSGRDCPVHLPPVVVVTPSVVVVTPLN